MPAREACLKQLKHCFDHINGKERHNFYCLDSLPAKEKKKGTSENKIKGVVQINDLQRHPKDD